jgi:hypothetical protein
MATAHPSAASKSFSIGDTVETAADAPAEYRHRVGFITEAGPGNDEYRVEFEDGETPTTGYLNAKSLKKAKTRAGDR